MKYEYHNTMTISRRERTLSIFAVIIYSLARREYSIGRTFIQERSPLAVRDTCTIVCTLRRDIDATNSRPTLLIIQIGTKEPNPVGTVPYRTR